MPVFLRAVCFFIKPVIIVLQGPPDNKYPENFSGTRPRPE